jgi:hypothetical protein
MRKERWQAGLIQGGENAVVQDCLAVGQLLTPHQYLVDDNIVEDPVACPAQSFCKTLRSPYLDAAPPA